MRIRGGMEDRSNMEGRGRTVRVIRLTEEGCVIERHEVWRRR